MPAAKRARSGSSGASSPGTYDPDDSRDSRDSYVDGVRDVLAVTALLALLVAVTAVPAVRQILPGHQLILLLAILSAGVGAMAAIYAGICARLTGDRRAGWMCAAIGVYSFLAVPAGTIQSTVDRGGVALGNVRLLANVLFVLTLFLAVRGSAVPRALTRLWASLGIPVLLSAGAVALALRFPERSAEVTGLQPLRYTLAAAAVLSGAMLIRLGLSERSRAAAWPGLGFVLIGVAHIMRVATGSPTTPPELAVGGVRLVGVGLVLLGVCALAADAFRVVDRNRADQRAQLRAAQVDLRQVAERDHELRNGLAGLAAVTEVLTADRDRARVLGRAVTSELARLHELLRADRRPPGPRRPAADLLSYRLEPLLREQVTLRRSAGMDIELDCDRELRVVGSPAGLAQVLVNVLANCERHAPGSEVRVRATRLDGEVLVRISDSGPGVPVGGEADVFGEGVRGAASDGEGLGLHIVRKVLAADGGAAYIESVPGAGCTVVLRLRSSVDAGEPGPGESDLRDPALRDPALEEPDLEKPASREPAAGRPAAGGPDARPRYRCRKGNP